MKHKSGVLASSAARSTTNEECDKPNVRSSKRRGEVVELAFLYKAVSLGFGVAKPYGDSECYDFIVDWSGDSGAPNSRGDSHGLEPGGCLWRVQVKSTHRYRKGGYLVGACHFSAGGTKQAYTPEQIDFLVVCIVPEDAWYVIPVQAFVPRKWLSFYPQNSGSKGRYEHFREAWYLMHCMEEAP